MIKTTQLKNSEGKVIDIKIAPLSPRIALKLGYEIIGLLKTVHIVVNPDNVMKSNVDIRKTIHSLMNKLPYEKFENIIMQLVENVSVGKVVVDKDTFDGIFTGEFDLLLEIVVESFMFNFSGIIKNNFLANIKKKITG